MRFSNRRLSAACLGAVVVVAACRANGSRGASADSNRPARADSSARSSEAGITRTDSVVLRTDKAQYRAGESMALTFENRSAARYTFNPCSRTIERTEGSGWTAVDEPGRVCTMEAWILDAHATRSGSTELPSTLPPGRYRVVVRMTMDREGATASAVNAVSDPIAVS